MNRWNDEDYIFMIMVVCAAVFTFVITVLLCDII